MCNAVFPIGLLQVRAYGPGLEKEGNAVSKPTHFTVETYSAGSGKVEVRIMDPQNRPVECEIKFNNDKARTYTVEYIPKTMGKHTVSILVVLHSVQFQKQWENIQ